MSAAASCRGAAEKESPPCLQCRSDTQNPGVETDLAAAKRSIGLGAKVAKVESANAYGLPAMAAAKADVPGARRTGHKKRTRGNTYSIADADDAHRPPVHKSLRNSRGLVDDGEKEEVEDEVEVGDDGDDSDDYGDLYMGSC